MAIGPEDAVQLTPREREQLVSIEALIDRALRACYPGETRFQVEFPFGAMPEPSIRVKDELRRRFESAGWKRFSLAAMSTHYVVCVRRAEAAES